MPELPEVETTCRGIAPHILGREIRAVVIRQPKLRWPIPDGLDSELKGLKTLSLERRAKYLLLQTESGTLILHLGMSGSLRILPRETAATPHDHFDLVYAGCCLRLRDPRRFGAVLWTTAAPEEHPLIRNLGPEPLTSEFNGEWLYQHSRNKSAPVKNLIMNGKVVAGVGNIYANESLFLSGIDPRRAGNRISKGRYQRLAHQIKSVLNAAISQGGTTLRDFKRDDGRPGYFSQALQVYGKEGHPCPGCGRTIRRQMIGQRSSFFCSRCQT